MYLSKPERFKTLYCDPGEDAGWALANGPKLLARGTEKMWPWADYVWMALRSGGADGPLGCGAEALAYTRMGIGPKQIEPAIGRIVCEDFRIYPWAAKELAWDQVRTARLIGALTMFSRIFDIPFFLQPAAIKDEAQLLGASEYYDYPEHPNRHQNDAIQHFVYFREFGPEGSPRTHAKVGASQAKEESLPACGAVKPAGPRKKGKRVVRLACYREEGHDGPHAYT